MAQLTCRIVDIMTGRRIVLLNSDNCERVDICVHDRARPKQEDNDVVATVDTTTTLVDRGEIGITNEIIPELDVRDGDAVEVTLDQKQLRARDKSWPARSSVRAKP